MLCFFFHQKIKHIYRNFDAQLLRFCAINATLNKKRKFPKKDNTNKKKYLKGIYNTITFNL